MVVCDLQVKIKLQGIRGCLTARGDSKSHPEAPWDRGLAVYAEAVLAAHGEVLGLPCRTRWTEAGHQHNASSVWADWLEFPVKVRSTLGLSCFAMPCRATAGGHVEGLLA